MYRNDRFGKLWASQSSALEWPTDTNAETGFGFLGTDTPTTGLHDAIIQSLDWKDNFLFDQFSVVCKNFGNITIDRSDAGSRNALSDALQWALLNQNQSSVDRLGIIRTATEAQAVEGTDNHLAIVPMTLARVLDNRLVWDGIKNKPATGTRWPTWDEVTNKPIFGSAAWKNADNFDYAGTAKAYYDSLTKDLNTLSAKLSGIAWDGQLNSGLGILDKAHGGRGRGDNSYDGEWFYANGAGLTNTGFVLGSDLHTKMTTGEDNGDNLDKSSNMNLDTWWGVGIRSSLNSYQTTWKHDSRSGATRQRGGLYLNNFVQSTANVMRVMNAAGDALEVQDGNKIIARNAQGYERFHVYDGAVWSAGDIVAGGRGTFYGQLEVRGGGMEIYGDTPFIDLHYGNDSNDYSIRMIAAARDRLELSSHFVVQQNLVVNGRISGGGLGSAAFLDVYDNGSPTVTDLPWGTAPCSAGTVKALMQHLTGIWDRSVNDPGSYAGITWGEAIPNMSALTRVKSEVDGQLGWAKGLTLWKGRNPNEYGGTATEVATTNTVAGLRDSLQSQVNDRVQTLRWIRVVDHANMTAQQWYGESNGDIISTLKIFGQVDGSVGGEAQADRISVDRLQFYKNGTWYTVTR